PKKQTRMNMGAVSKDLNEVLYNALKEKNIDDTDLLSLTIKQAFHVLFTQISGYSTLARALYNESEKQTNKTRNAIQQYSRWHWDHAIPTEEQFHEFLEKLKTT